MVERADARQAVAQAARHIRLWNVARGDSFQDLAMGEIESARESFRSGMEEELPGPGDDPLFDRLLALARQLDASPETVQVLCDELLDASGEAPAERARRT